MNTTNVRKIKLFSDFLLCCQLKREVIFRYSFWAFSLALLSTANASNNSLQEYKPDFRNLVIMDAGSSGSRVLSYKFQRIPCTNTFELLTQTPMVESNTPLSFEHGVHSSLLDEMEVQAKSTIESEYFPHSGVFVGGTAGLQGKIRGTLGVEPRNTYG